MSEKTATNRCMCNCACYKTAIEALEDLIATHRREADRLEALKNTLPELKGDAETAIWQLVMDAWR